MNTAGGMDTRFAAAYLGYSPATLRLWRKKGIGPKFQQKGRFIQYTKLELDDWSGGREALVLRREARRSKAASARGANPAKRKGPQREDDLYRIPANAEALYS
jgi:hypothetical protein